MGKEANRRRQTATQKYIPFRGATNLRNRLICATLSGKAIRIDEIRPFDQNPGIRDFEACLLRLLEKITNGCVVKINPTGTSLKYVPGLLMGGDFSHDTPVTRSMGYYLEVLVALAPFGREPLSVSLTGITNDDQDLSVDIIRVVTLPLYKKFGFEGEATLKVKRRGLSPLGGGEVNSFSLFYFLRENMREREREREQKRERKEDKERKEKRRVNTCVRSGSK